MKKYSILVVTIMITLMLVLNGCAVNNNEPETTPKITAKIEPIGNTDNNEQSMGIPEAAEIIIPSVVGISTITTLKDTGQTVKGVGSGSIMSSNGYILTNHHVVGDNPRQIDVSLWDGRIINGSKVWSDAGLDIAVVKIDADNLTVATTSHSKDLKVGQSVIAVGTPLSLQFQHTVTAGIVSALNRMVQLPDASGEQSFMEGLIQTDASINPGNSGGPLCDVRGRIIGINTIKIVSAEGMGFAIPVDIAIPIIERFANEGSFETPYIGMVGYDRDMAGFFGVNKELPKGIIVIDIEQNGPADIAGLKKEDVVIAVNDNQVTNMMQLRTEIYYYQPGDSVEFTIKRARKEQKLTLKLERLP